MIHASLKAKSNLSSAEYLMQMHYLPRRESAQGSPGIPAKCILYLSARLSHLHFP